jgi:TRAP-type C4-dicarboxylate transport system substrate-binding protein
MKHMNWLRPHWAVAVLAPVAVLLAAGCFGGSGKTKASVGKSRSLTLRMQAPDGDDPDAAYFAEQVKDRTDGRIRIVVDGDTYSSVDPDNELRLVRDLRSGKVAIAYVPSRAWERDGIMGFRALQAPFLVRDYAILRQITSGPISARMLRSLRKVGLVGLGLVPKQLRRPLGRRPLVSPKAFRDARIRVVTSPTSVLDLRALGARPLTNYDSREVATALTEGRLDGVETEAHSILDNGYTSSAPYLPSNLALFAKAQTIVVGRTVLGRLSGADQAAFRGAAEATVAHADPAGQERTEVARLCGQGLRLVRATAGDLAALRRASAPAFKALEAEPVTGPAIAAIEALGGPASAASLPACPQAQGTATAPHTTFPEGTFESRLTRADFAAEGATPDPGFPFPFRIKIHEGRFVTNEHPPFHGRVLVHGARVTFAIERPLESKGDRETLKWSYYRGKLTFEIVEVATGGGRVIYTAHPWRRIGP